jgi:hypothetical protein
METEIVKSTKKIIGYTAMCLMIGFGVIAQLRGADTFKGVILGLFFTIIASFFIIIGAILYEAYRARKAYEIRRKDPQNNKSPIFPDTGTNFRDREISQINGSRIEIKPTIQSYLFYLIVMGIAGFIFIIGINQKYQTTFSTTIFTIVLIVIVSKIPVAIYKLITTKIVFDQNRNIFWMGRDEYNAKTKISLQDIDSIQIITKTIVDSEGPNWKSYELNIVVKNGDRYNILDHSNIKKIMEEGEILSKFLGVPLKVY